MIRPIKNTRQLLYKRLGVLSGKEMVGEGHQICKITRDMETIRTGNVSVIQKLGESK